MRDSFLLLMETAIWNLIAKIEAVCFKDMKNVVVTVENNFVEGNTVILPF